MSFALALNKSALLRGTISSDGALPLGHPRSRSGTSQRVTKTASNIPRISVLGPYEARSSARRVYLGATTIAGPIPGAGDRDNARLPLTRTTSYSY